MDLKVLKISKTEKKNRFIHSERKYEWRVCKFIEISFLSSSGTVYR